MLLGSGSKPSLLTSANHLPFPDLQIARISNRSSAEDLAHAEPTIAGTAATLRMLAWPMNVEDAECANRDGVRTNELEPDEKILASALADAERIAGAAV